ncbi:hypothetical protein [Streptomyces flaveolus]|uniref:hypothetical protein n=1 Tax=Streptomyces flaveolus TaxID=67297 RepID=UPI0034403E12
MPNSVTPNASGRRFLPIALDLVRHAEQAAETMAATGRGEEASLAEGGSAGPELHDALQIAG